MEEREGGPGPVDERAAFDELDRLSQEIERRRLAREAASERFEAFIRSFQAPPRATLEKPPATAAASPPAPPPAAAAAPVAASVPVGGPSIPAAESSPLPAAPRKKKVRASVLVAGLLLVPALAALGIWMWRQQTSRSEIATSDLRPSDPPIGRSTDLPTGRPADPPTDRPADLPLARPADPPPAPTQLEIEITTLRAVWVRVLSDGERVLERELPADARVPVTAKQTIVIRAGNAGAVRIAVPGGEPEPLGPEGQPVTRTFTRESH